MGRVLLNKTNAVVTAIAMPLLSYRRAKKEALYSLHGYACFSGSQTI